MTERHVDEAIVAVTPPQPSGHEGPGADPLLLALARFVQALDRRYPGGPEQMRREGLAAGANMPTVTPDDPAA